MAAAKVTFTTDSVSQNLELIQGPILDEILKFKLQLSALHYRDDIKAQPSGLPVARLA